MNAKYYSCDLNLTPSRKRKRDREHFEECKENATQTAAAPISCFSNSGFYSTPKKIVAKRRFQINKNNDRVKVLPNFIPKGKLIMENNKYYEDTSDTPHNPFEVLRKPPKKKKRHTEELACFENLALNLDIPEKLFNPYEVVRNITDIKTSNCFSNPALNLKVHDASILCNPFEVQRQAPNQESSNTEFKTVSQNPFLISPEVKKELTKRPCQLKLRLPFTPTLGCRIDFKNVSASQLTPTKLLADRLVFSPVQTSKPSLESIGEESPTDIGKELDRYQLELENSINEAKSQKSGATKENGVLSPPDSNCEMKLHFKQRSKFIQTLNRIPKNYENKQTIKETFKQTEHTLDLDVNKEPNKNAFENNIAKSIPFIYDLDRQYQKTETAEVIAIDNLDELYGCDAFDKEDSFDIKSPAPFVRVYRKQEATKESVEPSKSIKSDEIENDAKKLLNVKNIIRKSIRKFVYTEPNGQLEKKVESSPSKNEGQKSLMNAVRRSFRRKLVKNPDIELERNKEISIIDCSERTTKLKTEELFSQYMNVEDLTSERNPNLRSSIIKSTRDVRNQLLKSVFHKKHEEYTLRK